MNASGMAAQSVPAPQPRVVRVQQVDEVGETMGFAMRLELVDMDTLIR